MIIKKIICILLVTILIFGNLITCLGTNNTETNVNNAESINDSPDNMNNEENIEVNTNTNNVDELNGQKEEVQNKINKVNAQLEYVQGEISNAVLEVQRLSDKIEQYENENTDLKNKLETLEKSVAENSILLAETTDDYEKKNELLKDRLVAIYETGEITYLEVLLQSESLLDFLSRYYRIKEIIDYDSKLIDEVDEKKKSIEIAKKKMENETAQIKILKARAEQTEIVLKNTRTLQGEYLNSLNEQEQEMNSEIERYKTYTAILESKIQAISTNIEDIQIQYTGGAMIWPVAKSGTRISSYFGNREHPISGVIKLHQGLDIANAGFGAPVVSALDGVVTYAGELGSYGNCVMVYHGDGITTVYGHGQKILTQKDAEVKQGDLIMEVGSTGNSTGPHLHFEVRVNGVPTNPLQFVKAP